jgi:hypothetical protein
LIQTIRKSCHGKWQLTQRNNMNIRAFRDKVVELLGQQSTWQGIAFLVALTGGKFGADLDWGQAAALGGTLSAILKTVISD